MKNKQGPSLREFFSPTMKFKLKLSILLLLVTFLVSYGVHGQFNDQFKDDEFADFEEFEDPEEALLKESLNVQQNVQETWEEEPVEAITEEDVMIEDEEDSDFEHFKDEEEFEGFKTAKPDPTSKQEAPTITIQDIPMHLRSNWDSYYLELLMIAGLVAYIINFITGRNKNFKLATHWINTHRALLEDNFSLVGDDGKQEIENSSLIKESENTFTLWCSGRSCCEGMLVELKLIKRQDLVGLIAQLIRPSTDQLSMSFDLGKEDMDSFVFCVAAKKTAARLVKQINDLSLYCPERKSGDKFNLPSGFNVMSEIAEVSSSLIDSKFLTIVNKFSDLIDYIHISDQFSGPKQTEETTLTKLPDVKKVILFNFNLQMGQLSIQDTIDEMKPLMQFVFYTLDRVKRFRLSREAKSKADKNRHRVEEAFLKTTHVARAEAAALRKEEKRRLEKEKIMQEEDPEKQRRWEEKEAKRQMKKKTPKMKQLKVKAL
ncbi:hypothetical protein M8J77_001152 [Diaphorina citri]|nr:hypothetical protein M8J77_001152 [Diaphorina citri]